MIWSKVPPLVTPMIRTASAITVPVPELGLSVRTTVLSASKTKSPSLFQLPPLIFWFTLVVVIPCACVTEYWALATLRAEAGQRAETV